MIRKITVLAASVVLGLVCANNAGAEALVPGSTFDVTLGTYNATTAQYDLTSFYTIFANSAAPITYNGVAGTLSESESTLSTGQTSIVVTLAAESDLFAETSTDSLAAFFAVGAYGNPMEFTSDFNLDSAFLTINATNGESSFDVLQYISQTSPFNGSFTNASKGGLQIAGVQNAGIDTFSLDLIGTSAGSPVVPTPTPEPSSLALLGTGLLSVVAVARRRFGTQSAS